MHGFVPSIDVGQGQGREANFIGQVTIAIALDHGNVFDLDRLSQNGDARKTATLIKLPLALFLPELAALPTPLIHQPWLLSPMERQLHPIDYPEPIVDLKMSYPFARDALWQLKSDRSVRQEKSRILNQHVERQGAR